MPTKRLLYPILPARINSKLMFPLCYKCSTLHSNGSCECKDNECSLIHKWTTPEVELATNHGYIIVNIYEVLHWERSEMIDMKSKKGGIFNNYINTFLIIKTEVSRYPDDVKSEEDKRKYIQEFEEKEGITLNEENIKFNLGLRSLAKLALNSFHGKFSQSINT